jgi:hypothetical protein
LVNPFGSCQRLELLQIRHIPTKSDRAKIIAALISSSQRRDLIPLPARLESGPLIGTVCTAYRHFAQFCTKGIPTVENNREIFSHRA